MPKKVLCPYNIITHLPHFLIKYMEHINYQKYNK